MSRRRAVDPLRRPDPVCKDCGAPVLFALTRAHQHQPLDVTRAARDDKRATVAVRRDAVGTRHARSLQAVDARPLEPNEHRYVPHAATCAAARPDTTPRIPGATP